MNEQTNKLLSLLCVAANRAGLETLHFGVQGH